MKLHLLGPSGSGITTLGRELAFYFGIPYIDSDDIFWERTDPPFTKVRPAEQRRRIIDLVILNNKGWVVGGSALKWGDRLLDASDLIVWLCLPQGIRILRLMEREKSRFGVRVLPGGDMYDSHLAFIAWAKGYEEGGPDSRSLMSETEWLSMAKCPVLKLEGEMPVREEVESVLRKLGILK